MTGFDDHAEGTDEDQEAETHYGHANENTVKLHGNEEHYACNHNQDPQ